MTKAPGRDESFSTFFSAHAEDMRRLAVFLTGDPEQGRDVAQEALVRTYRHWSRIKGEDPVPYTKRIVINLVRSAAIVMRYYEDMSEADIARVLDRPLNTIKSDIHRGLKRLRPLLEEEVRT